MTASPVTEHDRLDLDRLSVLMRAGSRAEHESAEGSGFVTELLDGRVNAAGYADYLRRLRRIYATLEEVGRELADRSALVDAVVDPALERLTSLEADLEHWAPGATREVESPATDAYVGRIRASEEWPGLYLAHHYTRYLGDLSGGQAIGRVLDRSFGLDGAGLSFYTFADVPKPKPYKDAYRARLDALGLTPVEKARVVAEVKVAFGLNQALFDELGADLANDAR